MQFSMKFSGSVVALILLGLGCGQKDEKPPTALVSGTVKYSGGSLPEGQVIFIPAKGEVAAAKFGADGAYQVQAAIGKNEVLVKSVEVTPESTDAEGNRTMEMEKSRLPDKYMISGQSGLEFDVKDGDNKFDITLE